MPPPSRSGQEGALWKFRVPNHLFNNDSSQLWGWLDVSEPPGPPWCNPPVDHDTADDRNSNRGSDCNLHRGGNGYRSIQLPMAKKYYGTRGCKFCDLYHA